jgi:hypothetical protein
MDDRVERRRPDRHQFALRLLRRMAGLALFLSIALWAVPRALVEFGVLGPTAHDRIDEAGRAIAAARAYGGSSGLAPLKAAEDDVARARALVQEGRDREARRAALRATDAAIEAQKMALVAHTEVRQQAEAVYNDLDRQINDLEKLYEQVTPGLQKEQTAQLLSLMKATRQSTGLLFLAYEQKDYGTVVDREAVARRAVETARGRLESARRPQLN